MSKDRFDLRHKETLRLFLKEYFELFFPEIVSRIRFETARFVDKELIALFSPSKPAEETEDRKTRTDTLILVEALMPEGPELILIHWEHMGEKVKTFSERMFHYFCGIYYKFRKPVFPIAMFTDVEKWRARVPDTYELTLFQHTVAIYGYRLIKLKDFSAAEFEQKAAQNPLAAAYLPLTDYPPERRPEIKAKAVKGISRAEKGRRQATLYSLIDASLVLTETEEKQYLEIIRNQPGFKEVHMVESIEEVGFEKGIERGMQQGMEKGLLIGEILMGQRFLKRPVFSRETLQRKSTGELKEILAGIEKNLNG